MYAARYHLAHVGLSSTRHLRRAACSELDRRMRFRSTRGGIPEAQRQVCLDGPGTSTATRTQPPEGSNMGEADGVHKRRMFRWPKEARELVREYKKRTSRSQEHTETGRRMLVTKLTATSGNPRDACLRFLRELGVNQKRAFANGQSLSSNASWI